MLANGQENSTSTCFTANITGGITFGVILENVYHFSE